MVKLAGLQHRQQVCAPQHRVLAHTQQQTLQISTQLDWLLGKQVTAQWVMLKTSFDARKLDDARGGRWQGVPGFEVDDNQRTNKESSPVSTPPSEDRVDKEIILLFIFVHI